MMRSLWLLSLLALIGCTATPPVPKPDPIAQAGEGMAGVIAHTESAQRNVERASLITGSYVVQQRLSERYARAPATPGARSDSASRSTVTRTSA